MHKYLIGRKDVQLDECVHQVVDLVGIIRLYVAKLKKVRASAGLMRVALSGPASLRSYERFTCDYSGDPLDEEPV